MAMLQHFFKKLHFTSPPKAPSSCPFFVLIRLRVRMDVILIFTSFVLFFLSLDTNATRMHAISHCLIFFCNNSLKCFKSNATFKV